MLKIKSLFKVHGFKTKLMGFIALLLTVGFPLFSAPCVFAAEGLEIHYSGEPGPIFNIANAAPGLEFPEKITFTNNYPDARTVGFRVGPGISSDLKKVVNLSVRTNPGNQLKYEKPLKDVYAYGEVWLDNLTSGQTISYDFILKMNEAAGNEYQGLSESFNINLGFVSQTVPVTSSPDGGILSTIQNVGGQILAATFPTVAVSTTTVSTTTTSAGEVAGASTEDGEVRGETDEENDSCFWWLWVLIGLAIVLSGYGYYLYKRTEDLKSWHVWPLVFAFLAVFAHSVLQGNLEPSWFCDWFWLLVFIELVLFFYLSISMVKEKTKGN